MLSLQPGRIIAGKYRLDHELARGGMGVLWVAFDQTLQREVAVKFIIDTGSARFEEASVRFEREARAAAQIRSPHVVQTYDYGIDGGHAYMVMELLEGEDLGVRLARERRLSATTVANVLDQIAKGLDAVHAAGIVHRDLKPGNVFLSRVGGEEIVKLIDFGVACSDERDGRSATQQDTMLGTVIYMAPEQALGEATVDHRADLWSLAVIVYRLLTGKHPFQGATQVELVLAICQEPITPPSEYVTSLSPAIDSFFQRAFARAPDARFQWAQEMASSFAAALTTKRTGTLIWGTPVPRAAAPSAAPEPANALATTMPVAAAGDAAPAPGSHPRW